MTDNEPIRIGGFRSFVEYKWAVTFEVFHWRYIYEPKNYDIPGTSGYLPDFYVNNKFFFEVKAGKPETDEILKASELSKKIVEPVYIANGFKGDKTKFDEFINGQHYHVDLQEFLKVIRTQYISNREKRHWDTFIDEMNCQKRIQQVYEIFLSMSSKRREENSFKRLEQVWEKAKGMEGSLIPKVSIFPYTQLATPYFIAALNHNQNQGWHDYLDDAKC